MQKTTASSIEELISIGIDPLCPMSSDRIKGHPISIRFNDDLIERDFSGGIRHSFGYFFEHQVSARKHANDEFCKALNKTQSETPFFRLGLIRSGECSIIQSGECAG